MVRDTPISLLQVTNIDEVFDALIEKPGDDIEVQDERIPYWTELWPSALSLSEYLVDHPELVHGKNVLEIGCGLGLPSLVAAKTGAKHVLATDYLADSLNFVEQNASLNHIEAGQLQTKVMDWRKLDEYENLNKVDVVLAADILYEQRYIDAFRMVLNGMLPNQRIVLAEPGRKVAETFLAELLNQNQFVTGLHKARLQFRGTEFTIQILTILMT